MKDRLTQFGVKCREFRSRYDLTMGDQARGLGLSVANVSEIERGKVAIPEGYVANLSEWMSLPEQDAHLLQDIAVGSRVVVKVSPRNAETASLAGDFALELSGLCPEAARGLGESLRSTQRGDYLNEEIRRRAHLARAAFSLGGQLNFKVLRIVENLFAVIDPSFFLQVVPDWSLGEYLQIYSDSDGKTVNRFVLTEWLYNASHIRR